MTVESAQIVNSTQFRQARAELGESFNRILGYFQEDSVKALTAIEEATRARNAAALVRPAHTLKGESLQFGAEPLGLLAEEIEKAARCAVEEQRFPDEIVERIAHLRPMLTETLAFFSHITAAPPVRRTMAFGRKVA